MTEKYHRKNKKNNNPITSSAAIIKSALNDIHFVQGTKCTHFPSAARHYSAKTIKRQKNKISYQQRVETKDALQLHVHLETAPYVPSTTSIGYVGRYDSSQELIERYRSMFDKVNGTKKFNSREDVTKVSSQLSFHSGNCKSDLFHSTIVPVKSVCRDDKATKESNKKPYVLTSRLHDLDQYKLDSSHCLYKTLNAIGGDSTLDTLLPQNQMKSSKSIKIADMLNTLETIKKPNKDTKLKENRLQRSVLSKSEVKLFQEKRNIVVISPPSGEKRKAGCRSKQKQKMKRSNDLSKHFGEMKYSQAPLIRQHVSQLGQLGVRCF